jgi:membrane protein YqaA with SNARE-associated domain
LILFTAILSTFGLAFFWFIGAIPAGIALNLPPLIAAVTAWASYTAGAALIVIIGAPLRTRLMKRLNVSLEHDPKKLFWRVWDRYGLIGLSLAAPVTVGSQVGALLGLALGVPPRRLVIGMALGVAVWCVLITLGVVLGLTALE